MRFARTWSLLFIVFVSCTQAASPHKEIVEFSVTFDTGPGNGIFVVGNHPDLGSGNAAQARKLRHTPGNVWTGRIAVQAGTQLEYRYIQRSTDQTDWCDSANAIPRSELLTKSIPSQPPAPYQGKTIYYLSSWTAANLHYNQNNTGTWVTVAMSKIGPGRSAGESLYKISGVGEAGENIEFVFNNGAGSWDNPRGIENYLTNIDVFYVQDKNVFSYQPPTVVSPPQISTQFINSTAPNIPDRNIRIYVPRGYTQNTWKRYPVLYLHDGQNVFDASTAYLNREWKADETGTYEMGQGRVREAIMVGVYNNSSDRLLEYSPPPPWSGGRGDAYASFLINNVRPYIDTNFRTLNDAPNTLTLGSSMGGLISLYLGREFTTFGKIGVVSPALWTAQGYVTRVNTDTKKPLRVYLDFGTNETESGDDWKNCLAMYDTHLAQMYAANGDVTFVAGCGHAHDEPAWAARFPGMLRYLLPAREEPAELTQREHPPSVLQLDVERAANRASFTYSGLFGFSYTIERSPDLAQWSEIFTTLPESLPWSRRTWEDDAVPEGDKMFWQLEATEP